MSQSKLFCSLVEQQFRALEDSLELLVNTPYLALKSLKGYLIKFEKLTLAVVEGRLVVLENLLNDMFNLLMNSVPFDRFDKKNVCALAFQCFALREQLFPTDENDPIYVQFIPIEIRNILRDTSITSSYLSFEKYVCKLGFSKFLRGLINETLADIEDELDELLIKLGTNKIDEWIQSYLSQSFVFLRELQKLDTFTNCVFEGCNFAATAVNKREDYTSRLYYEKQGDGWAIDINRIAGPITQKEDDLRAKIDELRTRLANPKFGSEGVKLSDLLKF